MSHSFVRVGVEIFYGGQYMTKVAFGFPWPGRRRSDSLHPNYKLYLTTTS